MTDKLCKCDKCGTEHYIPDKKHKDCHILKCHNPAKYYVQKTTATGYVAGMYLCEKDFRGTEDSFVKAHWAIYVLKQEK